MRSKSEEQRAYVRGEMHKFSQTPHALSNRCRRRRVNKFYENFFILICKRINQLSENKCMKNDGKHDSQSHTQGMLKSGDTTAINLCQWRFFLVVVK